jgi:CBS domain containing-hemolysin-like protein
LDSQLALVAVLLIFSAITSACETALVSITPAQVRTLVESKRRGAGYLAKLKQSHHKTLITILLLNNFLNIAISAITTLAFTRIFGDAGIGIATGVLTAVILVFGEIIPKSLATTYAKILGPLFAPALYTVGIILTPIIFVLDLLVNLMLRIFGAQHHIQVTDEELIAMASIGAEEGSIDEHEFEMIENALEFNDIKIGDIITPRVHMDALPEDHHLDNAAEFVVNHSHTRIPIYRDNIDHIVGILSIKELLRALHEEEHPEKISLRQIHLLTPLKVPDSMHVKELFREFKKKRQHMAIVIDEFGGTEGLVTMEDLLEELVGEIEDEMDMEEAHVKTLGKNHFELSGRTELDEIADITNLEFEHPEYKTVSFLIIDELGQLPREGQSVMIEGWQFTVTQMLRNTILKVELKLLDPNPLSPSL